MKIYFPECPIKSGVAREENFKFWRKFIGNLTELIIPFGEGSTIGEKFFGCKCKTLFKVQAYGCCDLTPVTIPINFHGEEKHTYVCVGELPDEIEIIKKDELEKLLGGVVI